MFRRAYITNLFIVVLADMPVLAGMETFPVSSRLFVIELTLKKH